MLRFSKPVKDSHRGRLAGAVRAEKAEDAARLDSQIDAAKRLDVAVALVQAGGLDGGVGRHPLHASGRLVALGRARPFSHANTTA
jgi:hypothetical protein